MASYRRFVSYIYQLSSGKKGPACGFVKVEIKNDSCTLWFQLKHLPPQETTVISIFLIHQEELQFLPVWTGTAPNGLLKLQLTTDSLHIFNTNYAFRQCAGVVFSQKNVILCGTSWNEKVPIPETLPMQTHPPDAPSQELPISNNISLEPELPKTPVETKAPSETETKTEHSFESQWSAMQNTFPPFDPFEEGGVVEGIKVTPSDLPLLECLPFDIGANRFLLHGYKNYHHLLLGRMEGQNRYILGIPGIYDSQEQFMAKTFGFPCFKPIRPYLKPVGQFGYWFRCIHS